jgi:antibiotic biosynthesis monooxygenase (ABM) superfamily enzyme
MDTPARHATLVTSRLVFAGREEAFARWIDRVEAAARESPGYLGGARMDQPGGLSHFLHRFASESDLNRWSDSAERHRLTEEADSFSGPRRQTALGLQPHFHLPSEAAAPKWRTWIATWAAVFPLLLVLNALVGLLPFDLPKPVELAATSLVMTATLTWLILPRVRKLLRPWLLCDHDGELRD